MNRTFVSLDLELTGTDPKRDHIIEIAAVRFTPQFDNRAWRSTNEQRWRSFINPRVPIPLRAQRLTEISQRDVDSAPPLVEVAGELRRFIGAHPIVGQSVHFDLRFLAEAGLELGNPIVDTFELASIMLSRLPGLTDYRLVSLAQYLGVPAEVKHRALADAIMAKEVFLRLWQRVYDLDVTVLREIVAAAERTGWALTDVFRDAEQLKARRQFTNNIGEQLSAKMSLEDLNLVRTGKGNSGAKLIPRGDPAAIPAETVSRALGPGGAIAKVLGGFEHRSQQQAMARAVTRAFNDGQTLLVEAGTGTGKSLAYLLPAAAYALANRTRVIVSTNTIALQDQLVGKDIPLVRRALAELRADLPADGDPPEALRVALVKGRANYLCLRRWHLFRSSGLPSSDELALLSRIMVWLPATETGDVAELNLNQMERPLWNKVCARADACGADCAAVRRGTCFVQRARAAAESAHLIVVNHALLLSDLATDSRILPGSDHIIIDEAHHLEDEATNQFGVLVSERDFLEHVGSFTGTSGDQIGPARSLIQAIQGLKAPNELKVNLGRAVEDLSACYLRLADAGKAFFRELYSFTEAPGEATSEYEVRLRLTRDLRTQPSWQSIVRLWEPVADRWQEAEGRLADLVVRLEPWADERAPALADLVTELVALRFEGGQLHANVDEIVHARRERDTIYWVTGNRPQHTAAVQSAPLQVGELLRQKLYNNRNTVVMTSATLSTEGNFDFVRERLAIDSPHEVIVGSPFDYRRSTLIYIPTDIPEPGRPNYQRAVEDALSQLLQAVRGRTLVLFTSNSALRSTYNAIKPDLERQEVLLLGQGIDGSQHQLLASFRNGERTVLFGTNSFWEGVDVVGDALSVLVITKLPFRVPSDPVVAARSETFSDGFNQYSVPQAILRFKQGFGRLIRSATDRGVLVMLDRRLQSKRYGEAFLNSLPDCERKFGPVRDLPASTMGWLQRRPAPPAGNRAPVRR